MRNNYHKNQNVSEIGIAVVAREGESFESLIKRFKKKVSKSGILIDLRDKMFHESKSERMRRKRQIASRRTVRDNYPEENQNEN